MQKQICHDDNTKKGHDHDHTSSMAQQDKRSIPELPEYKQLLHISKTNSHTHTNKNSSVRHTVNRLLKKALSFSTPEKKNNSRNYCINSDAGTYNTAWFIAWVQLFFSKHPKRTLWTTPKQCERVHRNTAWRLPNRPATSVQTSEDTCNWVPAIRDWVIFLFLILRPFRQVGHTFLFTIALLHKSMAYCTDWFWIHSSQPLVSSQARLNNTAQTTQSTQ